MTRDEQKIQTRKRVLDSEIEEFSKNGYAATKLGNIASKAGVVNSMVTHYFGSKEKLYDEAVAVVIRGINLINNDLGDDLLGMLLHVINTIKNISLNKETHFMFMSYLFTNKDIPQSSILKLKEEFEKSNLYAAMKNAMRAGTILSGGAWRVFYMFVASSFAITSSYKESNLALPDNNYYLRLIRYNSHVGKTKYTVNQDTIISIAENEVDTFIRDLKKVFDVVRIIDVEARKIREYKIDGTYELIEYVGIDDINNNLDTSLNAKAIRYKERQDEFKFSGKDMYQVSSQPIMISGKTFALELVILMKDNILLDAQGNIKVSNVIESINNRIYLDSLTGAYNRRYYDDYLFNLNVEQAFAILDIDNFKSVNDTYGHLIGDRVIKEIVECIKMNIRPNDALIRYGGDEFLLCFRNISEEVFRMRINDIKNSVQQIHLDEVPDYRPSISIGAIYNRSGEDIDFEKADALLYVAKKDKNTVVFADDETR